MAQTAEDFLDALHKAKDMDEVTGILKQMKAAKMDRGTMEAAMMVVQNVLGGGESA